MLLPAGTKIRFFVERISADDRYTTDKHREFLRLWEGAEKRWTKIAQDGSSTLQTGWQ